MVQSEFFFHQIVHTFNEWFYQPLNIFVAGFWSIVKYMLNEVQITVFSPVCFLKFHLEFHTTLKLQINLCRKYFGNLFFKKNQILITPRFFLTSPSDLRPGHVLFNCLQDTFLSSTKPSGAVIILFIEFLILLGNQNSF